MTLRQNNEVNFEVGKDEISIKTENTQVKEKKVKLPERWIKGFLQSQAIFSKSKLIFSLNSIPAKQFIASIITRLKDRVYILDKGGKLHISEIKPSNDNFIEISGLHRVKLLSKLIPSIKMLNIYKIEETGGTIWVIAVDNAVITLALSNEVSSGFSGEGEGLRNISSEQDQYTLDFTQNIIKNLDFFNIKDLSHILELDESKTSETIDILSQSGLVGYDCLKKTYFYRELPFKKIINSRLNNAKNLFIEENIDIKELKKEKNYFYAEAIIKGKTDTYLTKIEVEKGYIKSGNCSCEWITKNEGLKRGPCKHIIALRFFIEEKL
ncbi:MAG: hypothetical protein AABZ74_10265 [Cyanobacteriota bacterium]